MKLGEKIVIWLLCSALCSALMIASSYHIGKHDADKWWKAHSMKLDLEFEIIPDDCKPIGTRSRLAYPPRWIYLHYNSAVHYIKIPSDCLSDDVQFYIRKEGEFSSSVKCTPLQKK